MGGWVGGGVWGNKKRKEKKYKQDGVKACKCEVKEGLGGCLDECIT